MGLISFIREAGQKLFQRGGDDTPAAASAPAAPDVGALNATAAQAILAYVKSQGLDAESLNVAYDGATETVTVSGVAPDQATREKIVVCCGNVAHVSKVDDRMTVARTAEPPGTFHTVQKGDTLSKIAQKVYGSAGQYPKIFEANRPMLSDPDKIYPGQVLRIPPP